MNYTPSNANLLLNSCVGIQAQNGALPSSGSGWQAERYLAGAWFLGANYPAGGVGPNTPRLRPYGAFLNAQDCCDVWFNVGVWGIEFSRLLRLDDASEVSPVGAGTIKSRGHRSTRIKARVSWETQQCDNQMDIDIGSGAHFAVCAKSVRVALLVPNTGYNPAAPNQEPGRARGVGGTIFQADKNRLTEQTIAITSPTTLVIDAVLGGKIAPGVAPYGRGHRLTYTEQIVLGAGEVGALFSVPSHAKTLKIYSNTFPAAALPWDFIPYADPGAPGTEPIFGTLGFGATPAPGRNNDVIQVPQHAPFLRSPLAAYAGAAAFTLVWGLDF